MNMFWLVQLLVPLGICVVLPLLIVWFLVKAKINRDNKNAEIVLKAIENDSKIDADRLIEALGKKEKSALEVSQKRLLTGCIFSFIGLAAAICCFFFNFTIFFLISSFSLAIGLAYLLVFFLTRKSVQPQIRDIDNQ